MPKCMWFPCHDNADPRNFSCEFCFCPEYNNPKCPGVPKFILDKKHGVAIKDCSMCILPHTYEFIDQYKQRKKREV